jgi:tyrosinase
VDIEADESRPFCPKQNPRSRSLWMQCIPIVAMTVLSLVLGAVGTTLLYSHRGKTPILSTELFCKDPAIRGEWRSLSQDEKKEYIKAVQCLKETPSRLGLNQSLYDDFPYIHSTVGDASMYCRCPGQENLKSLISIAAHGSGFFLSWHRYFIHIYEQALREQCSYTHSLPYTLSHLQILPPFPN